MEFIFGAVYGIVIFVLGFYFGKLSMPAVKPQAQPKVIIPNTLNPVKPVFQRPEIYDEEDDE